MAARPLVTVQTIGDEGVTSDRGILLPSVFSAPVRLDVVHHVFRDMNKNNRQAYAVAEEAGHQVSARSWGTGRAVSRIPRVRGGGTHRSGQGAFGNMCRKGRMFAPTKTWRRWHRRINKNQRRFATCAALAASAEARLVLARGHRIEEVPEVPLVVGNESIEGIKKTKAAVELLKQLNVYADVERVKDSRTIRPGKGKARNRRYVQRRGPLVVYAEGGDKESAQNVVRAFRNIPGVELCEVTRLNLLQLAPGGHLGRLIVWTEGAFKALDSVFGTHRTPSTQKTGYTLPRALMTNADLNRIINSVEIQSAVRPAQIQHRFHTRKKNPLKNLGAMIKLNPYALQARKAAQEKLSEASAKARNEKRKEVAKKNAAFHQIILSE